MKRLFRRLIPVGALAVLLALALASLVVDLRITQVVNGVRGVHALLPHGAIGGLAS